jgi:hypothetical protein
VTDAKRINHGRYHAATAPEGADGLDLPRHGRQVHEHYRLKRAVSVLGERGLKIADGRTRVGKSLVTWRNALAADLGNDLSTAQQAVVDLAMRTKLLLDSIDGWLLKQPTLINRRKRCLLPVVRERQVLADALAHYLGQLGLERRPIEIRNRDDLRQAILAAANAREEQWSSQDSVNGP